MKKLPFVIILILILCSCSNQFESEKWLKEPEKRSSMVYDLINKYELEEMTETQIVDLLGKPEQIVEEPFREYVYYLGRAGLGVDDSLLRLKFNNDGELESYKITSD